MRLSISHKRDQILFDFFKEEIKELHLLEEKGEINVAYYDEMGVNLSPVVPYGYQLKGERHRLSSLPSSNQTVVGFMRKDCNFHGFRIEGAATAETTIECMDSYANEIDKKTVVILDNASIHKAGIVKEKIKEWEEKGLYLQFIPAYCPELNLIERLWLEFKYRWLDKPGYFESAKVLKEAIDKIVEGIGDKYTINFN